MIRMGVVLVGLACLGSPAGAQGPPPAGTPDFKILVANFGVAREPIFTEELVAISGRVYQFASITREVVVIEPVRAQVGLLDIERKLQSEISFSELEGGLSRVRATLWREAERREKTGKRADAIEAQMTRDLAEPRFAATFEPQARRVRLTNPTIEVVGDGEPDPDAARLALVGQSLATVAKLGAFRTPNDLPPFAELDGVAALVVERKLRPTELTYLYRLAGPPRKFRRTYRLAPGLTDRDREAIRRVDRLREAAPVVRYEKYRGDR
jgi:hypothetical protein